MILLISQSALTSHNSTAAKQVAHETGVVVYSRSESIVVAIVIVVVVVVSNIRQSIVPTITIGSIVWIIPAMPSVAGQTIIKDSAQRRVSPLFQR